MDKQRHHSKIYIVTAVFFCLLLVSTTVVTKIFEKPENFAEALEQYNATEIDYLAFDGIIYRVADTEVEVHKILADLAEYDMVLTLADDSTEYAGEYWFRVISGNTIREFTVKEDRVSFRGNNYQLNEEAKAYFAQMISDVVPDETEE